MYTKLPLVNLAGGIIEENLTCPLDGSITHALRVHLELVIQARNPTRNVFLHPRGDNRTVGNGGFARTLGFFVFVFNGVAGSLFFEESFSVLLLLMALLFRLLFRCSSLGGTFAFLQASLALL